MDNLPQTERLAKPKWRLVRREVEVRATAGERYVVDAWLDLAPPADAHADLAPNTVALAFVGNGDTQGLEIRSLTVNGEPPVRTLRAIQRDKEPRGTLVMAWIDPALRSQPWYVHLSVAISADAGRVAIPSYEGPLGDPLGESSVKALGVSVDRTRTDRSVVVDPWRVAMPGLVAVAGVIAAATAWIVGRRMKRQRGTH